MLLFFYNCSFNKFKLLVLYYIYSFDQDVIKYFLKDDNIIKSSTGVIQTADEFTNHVSPSKIGQPILLSPSKIGQPILLDVDVDAEADKTASQINYLVDLNGVPLREPVNQADTIVSSSDDRTEESPESIVKSFTRQVVMHTDDDISHELVCDVKNCFSNFKNKSSWYRHRAVYHGIRKKNKSYIITRYICKICDKSNVYMINFKRHYFDHHKKMDKEKVFDYVNIKKIQVDRPEFK